MQPPLTSPDLFRRPAVPAGLRLYAVGDVHGRADLLGDLLARIDDDLDRRPISDHFHVFLGDYVDRGPRSRQVLDQVIGRSRSHQAVCLKGNHETYLLRFLVDPEILTEWRQFGGLETLVSYGLAPTLNPGAVERTNLSRDLGRTLPPDHHQFLESLVLSFACGDYFFAHAGVRPGITLDAQREEDLLWIRETFLAYGGDFGKIVVHGHTPARTPEIFSNRINIDTGAYATGRLTCLILEGEEISFL